MFISKTLAEDITARALFYLGKPYDFDLFNCVHFVRQVYRDVGIDFPILDRRLSPPFSFNLTTQSIR